MQDLLLHQFCDMIYDATYSTLDVPMYNLCIIYPVLAGPVTITNTMSILSNKAVTNAFVTALLESIKVTVLLINNFIGAKVYCLKVALLCLFCVKWT